MSKINLFIHPRHIYGHLKGARNCLRHWRDITVITTHNYSCLHGVCILLRETERKTKNKMCGKLNSKKF